jgi:hypothetical protein
VSYRPARVSCSTKQKLSLWMLFFTDEDFLFHRSDYCGEMLLLTQE